MFSNEFISVKVNSNKYFIGLQNLIMYSENLKKIRLELKISAQKLADSLNVSRGSIVQYETGKRKPSYEFMESLHNVYNVNLNWLITGKGEMFIGQQAANHTEIDAVQFRKLFKQCMKEEGFI